MMKMILSDIAKLRKMPELAERIENYAPEPDQLAQEKAMLEIELLKAQIAREQAHAMSYQATAQLNVAKSGTEEAVASNVQSDTDLKNLDFVEQESGVKQERAKELHGEQANKQMEMKRMEHDFVREERRQDLLKEYIANKSK
jgi:replicative superfamily II helicase